MAEAASLYSPAIARWNRPEEATAGIGPARASASSIHRAQTAGAAVGSRRRRRVAVAANYYPLTANGLGRQRKV